MFFLGGSRRAGIAPQVNTGRLQLMEKVYCAGRALLSYPLCSTFLKLSVSRDSHTALCSGSQAARKLRDAVGRTRILLAKPRRWPLRLLDVSVSTRALTKMNGCKGKGR